MIKTIYFIGTMSSGKSTLINSLISREIMPSRNIACTSKIINYINKNSSVYSISIENHEGDIISKTDYIEDYKEITYIIEKYNKEVSIKTINVYGRIPFLKGADNVKIVDLPGPNNSNNEFHSELTYEVLINIEEGLIIYVMDGTNLSTNDSNDILKKISEKIKNTNVDVLFAINKIDNFENMKELEDILYEVKDLLKSCDIIGRNLYPVSAQASLFFTKYLYKDGQIDESYMSEKGYFTELEYIRKFREDIVLDNRLNYESLPFFNTGIENLREAIKKSLYINEIKEDSNLEAITSENNIILINKFIKVIKNVYNYEISNFIKVIKNIHNDILNKNL